MDLLQIGVSPKDLQLCPGAQLLGGLGGRGRICPWVRLRLFLEPEFGPLGDAISLAGIHGVSAIARASLATREFMKKAVELVGEVERQGEERVS
ncbi:MAG: hypothetical protein KAY24_16395 [Candidatus Eisenbacteria sp.]|nr:hypothetical protein [Candidatus Eisenbacteria bacterium]